MRISRHRQPNRLRKRRLTRLLKCRKKQRKRWMSRIRLWMNSLMRKMIHVKSWQLWILSKRLRI